MVLRPPAPNSRAPQPAGMIAPAMVTSKAIRHTAAINTVLRINGGHFFDLVYLMATVWTNLFLVDNDRAISAGQAWIAILVYCLFCLWLLLRKVRACEVVR